MIKNIIILILLGLLIFSCGFGMDDFWLAWEKVKPIWEIVRGWVNL